MAKPKNFICGLRIYRYKGWMFEVRPTSGPWPLKKNGSLRKRASMAFYKIFLEWSNLESLQREEYRVGRGCR